MNDFFGQKTAATANQPATDAEIAEAEGQLHAELPAEYRRLLKTCNGFTGEYGEPGREAFLHLWKVNELPRINESMRVSEFQPWALVIGGNGGDDHLGLDLREGSRSYGSFILIPFIMSWEDTLILGDTLEAFLTRYAEGT